MTKSLRGHYRWLGKEDLSLQVFPQNGQWRRWSDVQRQSVQQTPEIKRRPEKLDRRWLKDGCGERLATMTKQSKNQVNIVELT